MNSFQTISHCENNVSNIDVSQCSADLFQESQLECDIHSNFTSDIKFSNEKSSETSEELRFIPRRKHRRALSFSHDSSHCYSNKSSDSLRNGSNTESKFFQPISPVYKIDDIGSSSLLEANQSVSSETLLTPGIHHLSKENVAVISVVSDSEHSSSSSILENSLQSENEHQNSKQFFKTPICSSVKKRTIRQWLNNVSLNCSIKPNENGLYNQHEVVPPESNQCDSKPISLNVFITSSADKNNAHDETHDVNDPGTVHLNDDVIDKNNTTENYCPWMFDSFKNRRNECSMKQHEESLMSEGHNDSNEVGDHNTSNSCQKSPNKSLSFEPNYKLSKPQNRSFHEESEGNISKRGNHSLSFNKSLHKCESDDSNFLSADDSDSTSNGMCNSNTSKIVDSDDSFAKIKLFKKKKKRNCLNISSEDSEAKDTANESEDIPHPNSEPYTPRRKLYFRNPLNNSLDDDAEPLIYCKDYSIKSKDNSCLIERKGDKSMGLLDKVCSEVHNLTVNSPPICSIQNKGNSNDQSSNSGPDVESDPEQSDMNQINFSSLSISSTSKKNISEKDFNTHTASSNNESCSVSIDELLNSSKKLPTNLDDSTDSIVNMKRKSKKNVLNISSDNSFLSEKPNANIIDVNEIFDNEPVPSQNNHSIDLTKSDDEYDKFMYRTRSDSSFSDYDDVPGVSKDSSEVISVHTTTSEEDGGDEENAPWFDLESYLKKNIPASSKSFDSYFLKNSEKRKAQLAKISLPTHSSCPNHTSFLLSLTPEVPDEMCHPEAVKFRGESFSKNKKELVDLLFKLYNKEIFDEELPPLEIKWSGHLTTTSGITKSSSKITKNGKIRNSIIKLSKTVVDDASKLRDVLLHELCHAANWLIDKEAGGHGPLFKKWVNKIWIKFPEVPRVKTTHHYELKWKYLYKCSYCGYELGKMKLSLNETSCRLCGGLVTVNS